VANVTQVRLECESDNVRGGRVSDWEESQMLAASS